MAALDEDAYAVTNATEIAALLKRLADEHTLLRLDAPKYGVVISSMLLVLDVDTLTLDAACEPEQNRAFVETRSVRVQGTLDGVVIEFSGACRPVSHDGRPAFAIARPTVARRLQRREYYRVQIPVASPARCIIQHSGLSWARAAFALADISAGGVRLIDREALLEPIGVGTRLAGCVLDLDAGARVTLDMRLVRTSYWRGTEGRRRHYAAFCYVDVPPGERRMLQRYVGEVERKTIAKLRGRDI